jgi:hypothetical protein
LVNANAENVEGSKMLGVPAVGNASESGRPLMPSNAGSPQLLREAAQRVVDLHDNADMDTFDAAIADLRVALQGAPTEETKP